MQLPDGRPTQTVLLPIAMNGRRLGLRNNPPALGADAKDLLQSLGFDEASVMRLQSEGVLNRSSMEESQQS
jgi:crotonobetainyl-CoA:carnitine CoA-transferase CaiB-like acyl-CoA transferase